MKKIIKLSGGGCGLPMKRDSNGRFLSSKTKIVTISKKNRESFLRERLLKRGLLKHASDIIDKMFMTEDEKLLNRINKKKLKSNRDDIEDDVECSNNISKDEVKGLLAITKF